MKNKICVVGAGYVGLAYGLILSKFNAVVFCENNEERYMSLKKKTSYLNELAIKKIIKKRKFRVEKNIENAFQLANIFIICLPTDFNKKNNKLNTELLEIVIAKILNYSKQNFIIIKSTVPVGFCERLCNLLKTNNIIYMPEFLREGHSIEDIRSKNQLIFGIHSKKHIQCYEKVFNIFKRNFHKCEIIILNYGETESIKLFSNTYLAMRIAFFNELDTFCKKEKISSNDVIQNMCLDKRIGKLYNKPSLGFGGYCLPKDSRECFYMTKSPLIKNISISNKYRINFVVNCIISYIQKNPKNIIGFYHTTFKSGSENFKESASVKILNKLKCVKENILIYENVNFQQNLLKFNITDDLNYFKKSCDIIYTDSYDKKISEIKNKIF